MSDCFEASNGLWLEKKQFSSFQQLSKGLGQTDAPA